MYLNGNNLMVMEQNPKGDPGNLGDSCAESGRYYNLVRFLRRSKPNGSPITVVPLFKFFITDKGILEHPDSMWREDDTSGDQVLPLFLATYQAAECGQVAEQVRRYIISNGWRTGNGKLCSPMLWATINSYFGLMGWCLLAQAYLFKLPWRWSDSKKWFERSEGSTADYLNWFAAQIFLQRNDKESWASKKAMRSVGVGRCFVKCRDYYLKAKKTPNDTYLPEPNCDWVLQLYEMSANAFRI